MDALVTEYRKLFNLSAEQGRKLREHLDDWHTCANSDDDPANLVLDLYRLLRLLNVNTWDMNNPALAARMGCLTRFPELLADFEHVRRRARWVDEDGGPIYRGGQNRGAWYYRNLYSYIQYITRLTPMKISAAKKRWIWRWSMS